MARDHERAGLAVLLPASSRGCYTDSDLVGYAARLCDNIQHILRWDRHKTVVLGMDDSDPALPHVRREVSKVTSQQPYSQRFTLHVCAAANLIAAQRSSLAAMGNVTNRDGAAPICCIWGELAHSALQKHQANHVVLLGDDTEVSPIHWVQKVSGLSYKPSHMPHLASILATHSCLLINYRPLSLTCACLLLWVVHVHCCPFPKHNMLKLRLACRAAKLQADPSVKCLVLKDEADPGFPSFLVLATSHLSIFDGKLLPPVFLNQGGDPFLLELYRCIGAVDSLASVTVQNKQGLVSLIPSCSCQLNSSKKCSTAEQKPQICQKQTALDDFSFTCLLAALVPWQLLIMCNTTCMQDSL